MTLPPVRRVLVPAVFALFAGCGPAEQVKTYTVPKDPAKADAEVKPADGAVKSRLLGAIIPVGDNLSRFVKASGPVEKIDPHAEAFDAFVKSVRVTKDPANPVTYTVPEGWRPGPAKQMRVVTFLAGPPDKQVEVYISDPFGGSLLANVNRWRGEVGLKDVTDADLAAETTPLTLGETKAYKVDFRGPGGKSGMMVPPFAGK